MAYQPTTFLERGAYVPFTTPVLTGARVRPAERFGLELLMPNPSGGPGDYIVPWTGLRSLCCPTVHDSQLTEGIAALRDVTPANIRQVAREIASQGLAGRAAVAASSAALAAEQESRASTNYELLLRLVQQVEAPGTATIPAHQEPPEQLKLRAKRVIATISPRLRQEDEAIQSSFQDLASLFSPIGIGSKATRARLPHAVAGLKLMRREVAEFPQALDEALPGLIQMVINTVDKSLVCAETALAEARQSLERLLELLVAWLADRDAVSRKLARTDWLMDGWERIVRLWGQAEKVRERRDALDEIIPLLPIIPREAGAWVGFHIAMEPPLRTHRVVGGLQDWRTGTCLQDMIHRNEGLIAA